MNPRNWYIVICSSLQHPLCGATHVWYYDEDGDKWVIKSGTPYPSRDEAEKRLFEVSVKHQNQLGHLGVVEEAS